MFLTLNHAEIPAGLLIKNGHAWRCVEYLSSFPYFHVTAFDLSDNGDRPSLLLINSVLDLLDLAAACESWKVAHIQLVSPGHLNQKGKWAMDDLVRIQAIQVGRGTSYSYTVHSGDTYFERPEFKGHPKGAWRTVFNSDHSC